MKKKFNTHCWNFSGKGSSYSKLKKSKFLKNGDKDFLLNENCIDLIFSGALYLEHKG